MGFDPIEFLNSAKALARGVAPLLSALGLAGGLFMILHAGWLCRGGGSRGQDEVAIMPIVLNIFCGGALIQFGRTVSNTQALFGDGGAGVRDAMRYMAAGAGASPVFSLAMSTALIWLGTIGAIAVFRGVVQWRGMAKGDNQGGGGDNFFRGMWHILGGGICVNIGWG